MSGLGSHPEMLSASRCFPVHSRQRTQQRTSPMGRFGPSPDAPPLPVLRSRQGEPVVMTIKVEMPFGREAVKIWGTAAALQYREKLLCLGFAAFTEECLGGLKAGAANQLNVDVALCIEGGHLGFVDE